MQPEKHQVTIDFDFDTEEEIPTKIQNFELTCRECDQIICHGIILPNSEQEVKRLKAKCPCGGSSFIKEVPRKSHRLTPPDGLIFSGFDFDDDVNLKIVEMSNK